MGKKLIITEKPSVARDFARVLDVRGNRNGFMENDEYVISWCFGHLVEMVYPEAYDEKYKSWKLEDLPFLPKDYKYGVVSSAKNQYEIVNSLLHREDIETVYWAGDSGKEGQTIEENIRNYGGVREGMTELRVWIDSQTDEEILRGINEAKPMSDYALLGKSGIMRTIEDYSLGINFSRALSVKYGNLINNAAATKNYTAIAIGRVMTCVLGMVVNREREIRNFVETPFFRINGLFGNVNFPAEWRVTEGSKHFESPVLYNEKGFKKQEDAESFIDSLRGKSAQIVASEVTTSKKKAPLLFNLAEIQSECSKIFKISPAQTLQIVQDLYERKMTTYPRTDARVLTKAVAKEITRNLKGLSYLPLATKYVNTIFENKSYVGLEKTMYTDDSKVTDHYAIIPTGYIKGIDGLDSLHKAVYELIVKRFLSIFYPPAEFDNAKVEIAIEGEHFYASAKVLTKPGYMEITGVASAKDSEDEDDTSFKKDELISLARTLKKDDAIEVNDFVLKEGKTSPPKRYTSGNLILAMENAGNLIEDEELRQQIKRTGIGTSATRGEILDKLVRIQYLNQNSKTQIITPSALGEMIYEVVRLTVPTLLNPEMTASWEKGLEGIVNGTVDDGIYREKLEDFIRNETNKMIHDDLRNQIARNINPFTNSESRGAATRKPLGIKCPDCGGELTTTSFGFGCSNYFDENIKCGFGLGTIAGVTISEEDAIKLLTDGKTGTIRGFKAKSGKKFDACLKLSKNDAGKTEIGFDFEDVAPNFLEGVSCPDCGSKIQVKGAGFGCAAYNKDNPDSCQFFIGKIANKQLSAKDVTALLTEGKTGTIRGFKGKSGKKFDAVLILKKNDSQKAEIGFDFENVEVKKVKDVTCPICGGDIVKTSFGYGCSNYDRQNEEKSCRFNIGTICSVKLNDTQVRELINEGITSVIDGFKSKNGNKFSAMLTFARDDNDKITGTKFVFPDTDVEIEGIKCPKCDNAVIKSRFGYKCKNYSKDEGGCSFFIGERGGILIDEIQLKKLLVDGKTDKLTLTGKSGNVFEASFVLDNNKNMTYDFALENSNNNGGLQNG